MMFSGNANDVCDSQGRPFICLLSHQIVESGLEWPGCSCVHSGHCPTTAGSSLAAIPESFSYLLAVREANSSVLIVNLPSQFNICPFLQFPRSSRLTHITIPYVLFSFPRHVFFFPSHLKRRVSFASPLWTFEIASHRRFHVP